MMNILAMVLNMMVTISSSGIIMMTTMMMMVIRYDFLKIVRSLSHI